MDTNIHDQKNVQLKNYVEKYNEFIDQLKNVFQNDEQYLTYINNLLIEDDHQKWDRGVKLSSSIKTTTQFNNLLKGKIKIFSSKKNETYKISISLFGSQLPLKKLFNNRPIETKTVLWNYLHLLLLFIENNNKNQDRIDKLLNILQVSDKTENPDVKNNILNIDVNSQTNNMINDVINSFEKSLETNEGDDANPFKDIMKITNMITEKYQDDIESGEINLDGLLNNIQNQIPGLDTLTGNNNKKEKTIIDENFSTANVETGCQNDDSSGLNLGNMMKMMNSIGGGMGDEIGGLFQMMKKADTIETKEDANNLQQEMNKYLEEKMGVDMNQLNKNILSLDKEPEKTYIYKKNNIVYKIINDILHWAPMDNNGNYDQVFSIVEEVGYNPETGENTLDNQEFSSKEDISEIMNNLGANNYETLVNGTSGVIIRVLNNELINYDTGNDESANDESANDESANDESANDESANDESANDESANDESANNESANEESANDESANDESANEESANEESANDESANDESANDESANDESANDESTSNVSASDDSAEDNSSVKSINSSDYNSEENNSSDNNSGPTIEILNEDNTDVEIIDNIVILS